VTQRSAYRLGSTSYVHRAGLVENAMRLADVVRDIELVLFDGPDGAGNIPDAATVADLARIGRAHDLTYTVHLPHDLGAPSHPSIDMARRIIETCAPLQAWAYVFHIETADAGSPAWTARAIDAVRAVAALVPDPRQLTLENLESYHPDLLRPIFAAAPVARALDIGHLWKAGLDPRPYLAEWLPHARVAHLHGCQGRDHRPLSVMPPQVIDDVLRRLQGWDGVLTLEVFEDDFFASHAAWAASVARLSGEAIA